MIPYHHYYLPIREDPSLEFIKQGCSSLPPGTFGNGWHFCM